MSNPSPSASMSALLPMAARGMRMREPGAATSRSSRPSVSPSYTVGRKSARRPYCRSALRVPSPMAASFTPASARRSPSSISASMNSFAPLGLVNTSQS